MGTFVTHQLSDTMMRSLLVVLFVASCNAYLSTPVVPIQRAVSSQRSALSTTQMFAGSKKAAPKKVVKKVAPKKVVKKVAPKKAPTELSPLAEIFSLGLAGGAQTGTFWG